MNRVKLMSETIYFELNKNIEYNQKSVKIGGIKLPDDVKGEEESWEQVAERFRDTYLKKHLQRQYENTVVLTGAGSSYQVGSTNKQGKLMSGLWTSVVKEITYKKLEAFCDQIKFNELQPEDSTTDIEALLSHANLFAQIEPSKEVTDLISKIKGIIKKDCRLSLPKDNPHQLFLKKLVSKKIKYNRPKIFTLNYDTLFEQAAQKNGFIVIDGFSFSYPRTFSGLNFDLDIVTRIPNKNILEDNFTPNVVQIYKPHGSINWAQTKQGVIIADNPKNPLMIYPSTTKFEISYQQPFFEMMSRFQQETRAKNTLLIITGYSFNDKHINAMIIEALDANPSITMILACPDVDNASKYKELKMYIKKTKNLILTKQTFEQFVTDYPYSTIYNLDNPEVQND